jgi:hypothetical protein
MDCGNLWKTFQASGWEEQQAKGRFGLFFREIQALRSTL